MGDTFGLTVENNSRLAFGLPYHMNNVLAVVFHNGLPLCIHLFVGIGQHCGEIEAVLVYLLSLSASRISTTLRTCIIVEVELVDSYCYMISYPLSQKRYVLA